jgi:hypothetical protein
MKEQGKNREKNTIKQILQQKQKYNKPTSLQNKHPRTK